MAIFQIDLERPQKEPRKLMTKLEYLQALYDYGYTPEQISRHLGNRSTSSIRRDLTLEDRRDRRDWSYLRRLRLKPLATEIALSTAIAFYVENQRPITVEDSIFTTQSD